MKHILNHFKPIIISIFLAIILSTVIILFAEQYKINIKTGTIVRTGMISIKGVKDATISLDGQPHGISPKTINFVEAGEHILTLEKNRRVTWKRTINVQEGKVITLFPILFPEQKEVKKLEESQYISVIPTESTSNYFTVNLEGEDINIISVNLYPRLLDIGIKSSNFARINQILDKINIPPKESKVDEIKEKLSYLQFVPSPQGKCILINDLLNNKIYLVEAGQENIKDITSWFGFPYNNLYWSKDEGWVFVKNQSMLLSIMLKTGQRFVLYTLGENQQYGPITPTTGGVIFTVERTDEGKVYSTIFRIDDNGMNLKEIKSEDTSPSNINDLFVVEQAGIVLINGENSVWILNEEGKPPKILKNDYKILFNESQQQWVCSIDTTTGKSGLIFHFNPLDPDEEVKINYPIPLESIKGIRLINGHQNIVFETEENILISTEDGNNTVKIVEEEEEGKYKISFLGAIYHRGQFVLRYSLTPKDSPQNFTIYELRFDN
uniref:PEGA domain-containing protein n=1 Tax=candidate division CPR3 bacterium TaxID=2268181 RepID=A0A7C5YX91_UNCC3